MRASLLCGTLKLLSKQIDKTRNAEEGKENARKTDENKFESK